LSRVPDICALDAFLLIAFRTVLDSLKSAESIYASHTLLGMQRRLWDSVSETAILVAKT